MNRTVGTAVELPRPASKGALARTGLVREYGILISFTVLFAALAVSSDKFLTVANLENLLAQQAPTLIVATASTLVLIAGGFDLSVGAIVSMSGVAAAMAALALGPWPGVLAGTAAGAVLGLGNGLITTVGRVKPLIATLGTSYAIRGLAVMVTGGLLVTVSDPAFTALGQGDAAGLPVSIVVMAVVVGVFAFLLSHTSYGRRIYAVGGNPEAARLAGIRVELVRCSTFVISGLAAGVAGAMLASRFGTGQADAAVGLEITVLAAIVVGGTSIQGGEGAIWRTVVGVLFIALIDNGFTLLGLDPTYAQIVLGLIVLTAVAVDSWSRPQSR